jgi:carbon monoxide dehydrogenase subunit G
MRFEHKVIVDAPRQKVRDFLDDFNKAAYCIPDLKDLKQLGPDEFEGTIRVRIGPSASTSPATRCRARRRGGNWRVRAKAATAASVPA